jgi:stage II sporulation protein D
LWGADALARAEVSGEGVLGCESGRREFSGRVAVAATAAGLTAELGPGQSVSASVMRFSPAQPGAPLALGERRYRGDLLLSRADEGLRIVNEVELEDYVKGVVPNEMFREEEAFRVQAVVSRTFALYVRDVERRHAADGFDLCDGWCCQVYRGYDSEDPLANQAVDSTRGEVLLYQGKPILAAYDANAGGRTCAVDEAWPGSIRRDFPYLRSLASPDDVAALELKGFESSYRWQVSFPWEQLLARLDLSADKMGEPRPPRLLTGPSGRVVALILRGSRGLHRLDRPEAIRRALGLKSARFRVELDGGLLRFSGLGNGHGVGLSQHGAFGMAKRGLRHAEILRYYYPGAELVEIHSVGRPPEPRLALWKPPAENAEEGKLRP